MSFLVATFGIVYDKYISLNTMLVHPFKYRYHFLTWPPMMACLWYDLLAVQNIN